MISELLSTIDNLPDIWGEGAIFAFSGMDGPTSVASQFVATYGCEPYGLLFHTPRRRVLALGVSGPATVCVATGDVFGVETPEGDLLVTFSAWHTVIGAAPRGTRLNLRFEDGPEAVWITPFWVTQDETNGGSVALAMGKMGRFAVSYGETVAEACERARAGLQEDLLPAAAARLAIYGRLPPLEPAFRDRLLKKCAAVMKVNTLAPEGNIAHRWSTPDRVPHRDMWLWDSVFHSLGADDQSPALAWEFLQSMLDAQLEDGMIPFQVGVSKADTRWTQPPILAWGVWENYETLRDKDALAYALPRLERYLAWNCARRDDNHNGLPEWALSENPLSRGGESGLDNSPRFDRALPFDAVDFSTFLAQDMAYTGRIAAELGQQDRANEWHRRSRELSNLIHTELWDETDGFYYDRYFDGSYERVRAVSGFFPLLLDDIPSAHVNRLVETLQDPAHFGTPAPVPSIAASEPAFSTDMWRGPAWVNTNYIIVEGLLRQGLVDLASSLARSTVSMVAKYYERSGVLFEFYDAADRVPPWACDRKGTRQAPYNIRRKMDAIRDYHWTAALIARLLLDGTDEED